MVTTEVTIELILTSSLEELKQLAISEGFVFEHNVTVPALQGLLMPKALKRSHEDELHQIRMQLQAIEEETARLKAARENFVFEQPDREAARAEQEATDVSQRKLEVNNLKSLIAEHQFTAEEVIHEVYEETREVAEEETKRKHELKMHRKHEMQIQEMHAQQDCICRK